MMKYRISAVLVLVVAVAFSGCLQKNSTGGSATPQFPSFVNFQGPASANTPADLQNYINTFNANTGLAFSYLTFAQLQTPKVDGNTTTWTITSGDLVATIEAVKDNDSADWTFKLNGTDQGGTVYDHWTLMSGTSSMDGKSGTMHIYDQKSEEIALFEWSEDSNANKNAQLTIYGSPNSEYDLVNNSDHSGSIDVFSGSAKTYHAVWAANGSGSWEEYDSSGNVKDSGSWN